MKSEPRRAYAPPAVLSQSQFERRGILTVCCQTAGNCASEGGVCTEGPKAGDETGLPGTSTD